MLQLGQTYLQIYSIRKFFTSRLKINFLFNHDNFLPKQDVFIVLQLISGLRLLVFYSEYQTIILFSRFGPYLSVLIYTSVV